MLVEKTQDFDPPECRAILLPAINERKWNSEICTFLLERNLDLHARGEEDNTALHVAARTDEHAFVEELLNRGVDASTVNSSGCPPLQTALDANCFLVFLQLLKLRTAEVRSILESQKSIRSRPSIRTRRRKKSKKE
jgi:ankyrin repeat protein